MKILIVEDEMRAARQLQNTLKACEFNYHLLGVLDSVEQTVKWFEENPKPDLVFMDIQLADGLSFEIFQQVEITSPIIFTTAFNQYAIKAFKVNSVDYLLKPIQKEDLNIALDKFKKSNQKSAIDKTTLAALLKYVEIPRKRKGLLVKEGSGFVQINVDELLYAYSEDRVTLGVTASKRYIIDETLDQLYNSLDENDFFKINRGQLVAKSSILKIEPYFNHRLKLSLTNPRDQEFIVSRAKAIDFKEWMNC